MNSSHPCIPPIVKARLARACTAGMVHSCPARSNSVGLVVMPWNIPRGRRDSHSVSTAVSRKRRLVPRFGFRVDVCGIIDSDDVGWIWRCTTNSNATISSKFVAVKVIMICVVIYIGVLYGLFSH